jgi:hypothetical protein
VSGFVFIQSTFEGKSCSSSWRSKILQLIETINNINKSRFYKSRFYYLSTKVFKENFDIKSIIR